MVEIRMPEAGFSITEGTIIEWYKNVGDAVADGENVVCVETDKLTVDIPAERGGKLHEVKFDPGEVVPVGEVMGLILEADAPPGTQAMKDESKTEPGSAPSPVSVSTAAPSQRQGKGRLISPAAKAIARSKGIDLKLIVSGSGPHGRIVKQDVLDFVSKPTSAKKVSDESTIVKTATAGQTGHRAAHGQRIEFTGWRKVIADRMLRSKTEIPHYTMNIEIDVTDLDRLIQRLRETEGKKITYLPFMMKALEQGIGEAPEVNAFCDGKGFSMMQEINMGLAVDLGQKLLVPVVHDVQSKSVLQLFDELGPLINKAREDRLDPADVEGGTMTLTNVGMFKIHSANSVIVQPQVTIIYMGTAREVPAVHEGHIEIRKRMICGATFDHRVVNGAQGGRFLVKVKEYLEDMGRFVMHIR